MLNKKKRSSIEVSHALVALVSSSVSNSMSSISCSMNAKLMRITVSKN